MPNPDPAIEAICRDAAGAGLVLDFDGVLSPIVTDPGTSRMLPDTPAVLESIAAQLRLVAVISGRPLDFLVDRATLPGVRLLGSYGVETVEDGVHRIHPGAAEWMKPIGQATSRLSAELSDLAGVTVEEKGMSVAVHWRNAVDREQAKVRVRSAVADIAAATGLHRQPGKLVEELRPPLSIDKGTAIAGLIASAGLRVVAYAGDDLGDTPAFNAVREVGGHALLVDHGAETDQDLRSLATQSFDGVEAFGRWLKELAARLGVASS
jgi:trehalose 6-phosphate phosphatase